MSSDEPIVDVVEDAANDVSGDGVPDVGGVESRRDGRRQAMHDRILATADRLFYGEGIRAVGVDTIAAAAGISKRTLYNHFPSKDALIVAYLKGRLRPRMPADSSPREQVLKCFERIERGIARPGFRGCPFVNAVAELSLPAHPASKVAMEAKEDMRLWMRARLVDMGLADPDDLAMQLAILLDGALVAGLVRGNPGVARTARSAAEVLIDTALAGQSGSGATA
jgi:AcrR family transcriptional regulator